MEQIWDNLPAVAKFAVPFLLVLGLVGLAAFLWQRFRTATANLASPRGKGPRLAVIDTAVVDARRRLVLIRRDNAEHLLLIGGPADIVIEANIDWPAALPPAREAHPVASPDRPVRRPQLVETAAPASLASEPWSGSPPDQAQAAGREPVVIPHQELRPGAGQGSSQDRYEEPIVLPSPPRTPPAPEPPVAASAEDTSTIPPVRDVPAPATAEMPPAPVYPAVAPRVFAPVFSSVPESARPPAPVLREPVIEAPPAPAPIRQPEVLPEPPPRESVLPNLGPGSPEPKPAAPLAQPGDAAAARRLSPPPPSPPRPAQVNDANLAELAQRLEAALRRSTRLAEQQAIAPPAGPNALPRSPARFDPAATTRAAAPPKPPPVAGSEPAAADQGEAARAFEGIESEMAKMFGRPPGNPPKP